jgi:hypothetical protein
VLLLFKHLFLFYLPPLFGHLGKHIGHNAVVELFLGLLALRGCVWMRVVFRQNLCASCGAICRPIVGNPLFEHLDHLISFQKRVGSTYLGFPYTIIKAPSSHEEPMTQ